MSGKEANEPGANADALRVAIDRDYERLCAYMAGVVQRVEGPLRFDRRRERAEEVVAVAVERALARADAYDPRRAAFPWVMRIACNVLRELGRSARRGRQVRQTDLGEEAWERAMANLIDQPASQDEEFRYAAIAKAALREDERRLVELGIVQGLSGVALAREIGAPSPAAARTRLCRALQALRAAFRRARVEDLVDAGGQQP